MKISGDIMKNLIKLFFLLLLFSPSFVFSQTYNISQYREQIKDGNPVYAAAFLRENGAAFAQDADEYSNLKALAQSVNDFDLTLKQNIKYATHNTLNGVFAARVGNNKVLSKAGIGPEPEKVLTWINKYSSLSADELSLVKKALRTWEIVFPKVNKICFAWGQAEECFDKTIWGQKDLLYRNATIAKLLSEKITNIPLAKNTEGAWYKTFGNPIVIVDFVLGGSPAPVHLSKAQWEVGGLTTQLKSQYLNGLNINLSQYSDEQIYSENKEAELRATLDKAIKSGKLTPLQIKSIDEAGSTSRKMYLLGKYFDGSDLNLTDDELANVNAQRVSYGTEIFSKNNRDLLGTMLNTGMKQEISGTSVGSKILAGGNINLRVEYIDGYSALNDDGSISVSASVIQEYMRIRGYTVNSVLTDKQQLDDIAEYLSPIFVHEAAKKQQNEWMKKNKLYKPVSQEDEIDAAKWEAQYISEKNIKDANFFNNLKSVAKFSKYADQRVKLFASSENDDESYFENTVVAQNAKLPSLDSAVSNILNDVNEEVFKRRQMSEEEKSNFKPQFSYEELYGMSAEQVSNIVAELDMKSLYTLQADMLNEKIYRDYYDNSLGDNLPSVNTAERKMESVVPSLKKEDAKSETPGQAEWLFMVYVNAANDLGIGGYSTLDLDEMRSGGGSTDKIKVVVEYSDLQQAGVSKTILVGSSAEKDKIIYTTSHANMGDYKHLINFAKRAIQKYPAKRTALIVWNHGAGIGGISFDDLHQSMISIKDLGTAVSKIADFNGGKIDVYASDACLMQMASVAYELKDYADLIVGSQESAKGTGFPYAGIVKRLNYEGESMNSVQLGMTMIEGYEHVYSGMANTTMSLLNANKMIDLKNKIFDWIGAVRKDKKSFDTVTAVETANNAINMDDESFRDLRDYMSIISETKAVNANAQTKTNELIQFIDDDLVIKNFSTKDTYGISIYIPYFSYDEAQLYENLMFPKESGWGNFLIDTINNRAVIEKAK